MPEPQCPVRYLSCLPSSIQLFTRQTFYKDLSSPETKKCGNRHVKHSLSKISNTLFVYETIKIYRKQQKVGYMYKTILNLFTRWYRSLHGNISHPLNFLLLGFSSPRPFSAVLFENSVIPVNFFCFPCFLCFHWNNTLLYEQASDGRKWRFARILVT